MSDEIRLLEARLLLHECTGKLAIYREGRIKIVGMSFGDPGKADPNLALLKRLKPYVKEIEHLLPNEGDRADLLPPPALAGMVVVR